MFTSVRLVRKQIISEELIILSILNALKVCLTCSILIYIMCSCLGEQRRHLGECAIVQVRLSLQCSHMHYQIFMSRLSHVFVIRYDQDIIL